MAADFVFLPPLSPCECEKCLDGNWAFLPLPGAAVGCFGTAALRCARWLLPGALSLGCWGDWESWRNFCFLSSILPCKKTA